MIDLRCLYCGQAMDGLKHHADPLRDEHQPYATESRDPYVDASTPVALPPGVAERKGKVIGRWARRG